jgi:hypothetical protein
MLTRMNIKGSHEEHGAEYPQPKSLNAEPTEGVEVADYLEIKSLCALGSLCGLCVELLLFLLKWQGFVRKKYDYSVEWQEGIQSCSWRSPVLLSASLYLC